MPVGSTAFPAALDSLETLIEQHDGAITTLTGDITAGSTELDAGDTATFPATGVVAIEGEYLGYTSKTASTLTGLTRGLFQALGGSAAASHLTSAAIEQLVIAGTHKVQNDAIIATQTKLGFGDDVAALNEFLVGTGVGSSGWRALTSGDISTALGFTPANLAGAAFSGAISVDDGAGDAASAGSVRLRNLGAVSARNAAGSADVDLVALDASDRLSLRGGAGTLTAAGLLTVGSLATTTGIAAGGAISGVTLALGTNPASAGALRLTNNQAINARNAGNSADVHLATINAAGSLLLGPNNGITINGSGVVALANDLAVSEGGTGASDAAGARTNLGAQASHGNLSALAGLSLIADRLPYANGAGTLALATLTAGGRAVLGLTATADRFPYWTSASVAALGTITAAGRALLDDADAAAQRDTLGLGGVSQILSGSKTWDPPSIVAGGAQGTTITIAGAVVGDGVLVEFTGTPPGTRSHLLLRGEVSSADTVTVWAGNNHSSNALDLGSGTLQVFVFKP